MTEKERADLDRERLAAVLRAMSETEDAGPKHKRDWLDASARAFEDMQGREQYPLSPKQAKWVAEVAEFLEVDLPEPPRGPMPKGKHVALLVDTMKRPLAPPGRR